MGFRQFILEALIGKNRKFISAFYNDETQDRLRTWCLKNGFDLSVKYSGAIQHPEDFDFHSTVFYSDTKHLDPVPTTFNLDFSAKPISFEYLGENKNIPVIKIQSEELSGLRKYCEGQFNMKDSWSGYTPHITLSYDTETPVDLSKLKLPTFKLTGSLFKVENIKD